MIKFATNLQGLKRTSGLVSASSDYTCMLLFSPNNENATVNPKTLFFARNSANPSQYIRISRPTDPVFGQQTYYRLDVGSTSSTPSTQFYAGKPYQVWYVRTGDSHKLYVQGELLQTVTLDISTWTLNEVYLATADVSVASSVPISVGAFREWSVALTPTQLKAEVNSSTPVVTSGLHSDTPLLTDLLDDSGNGRHWALTAAAGTFYLHKILDPEISPQNISHTVAEHNVNNEIIYTFSAVATEYVGFTVGTPKLDVIPPGAVSPANDPKRLSFRDNSLTGWFKIIAGDVYTARLSNEDSAIASDFTFHIELAPDLPASLPANALIINDDTTPFPATVYASDGTFLGFSEAIPQSEIAAALLNGYTLWHDQGQIHGDFIDLLAPDLSLVSSFNLPGADALINGFADVPRFTVANNIFYIMNPDTGAVYTYTTGGTLTKIATVTGFTGTSVGQTTMGVSADGSILYFTIGEEGGEIKRWNLITDTAMSDLYSIPGFVPGSDSVAVTPNDNPGDLIVQSDGSIVTWWYDASTNESKLIRISAAGVLLNEVPFDFDTSSINHLTAGETDPTKIIMWVWEDQYFSQGGMFTSTLTAFGTAIAGPYRLHQSFNGQGENFLSGVASDPFAPSESCQFIAFQPTTTVPTEAPEVHPPAFECECPCDCGDGPSGPIDGFDPDTPSHADSPGPHLHAVNPEEWLSMCEGPGNVPTAADPVDAESWVS